MSALNASNLTVGAAIFFRDMISLLNYAGTVSAVTPNNSLTVSVPNGGGSKTFAISGDQSVELPIYPLL